MTGRSAPKGASLLGVYNKNRPECSILPAAFVAAYLVHGAVGIPLQAALVFGVLIAATDPISVLALFKEMGAPKRLGVIIEGESLFNDGTAVVLFQILVAGMAGTSLSVAGGVGHFLVVALGGGALGIVLGYAVGKLTERIDEPRVEIMLTTVLAYGSFLLAEQLDDGGWVETTRPPGQQSYAQHISTSGWATLALLATRDRW